jgi:L-malate glycosyltransferase
MSKVMYMLNYVGDGGTEKYVLDLISATKKNECLLVYSTPGPFLDRFKDQGIPIYQVTMKNPFDIKAAIQIKQIIKKEHVKIVHTQFLRENYIAILAKLLGAKIHVIWTYHVDIEMPLHLKYSNTLFTRLNHTVICVSNFMKEQIVKKGVPLNKIKVIYNGIKDPLRNSDNSSQQTNQFAVIGRISEEKGHSYLLSTLKRLLELNPSLEWHCNIIGNGPLKGEIIAKADNFLLNERITFKGYQKDIVKEYEQNDFIVIPSKTESLSYVAIEALAMKKPVIAANVGGLPEVIRHGQTGLLISYGDEMGLAQAIQILLQNTSLKLSMGEQGRQYYLKSFSFPGMIQETFTIYNNCRGKQI